MESRFNYRMVHLQNGSAFAFLHLLNTILGL